MPPVFARWTWMSGCQHTIRQHVCTPGAVALEGWGEEEQDARAAPDDLVTSYPGTGRKSALLGRVRTCQGAC